MMKYEAKLIDDVKELQNSFDELNSFAKKFSSKNKYVLSPEYLMEKMAWSKICVVLIFYKNALQAYTAFEIVKSDYEIRFSVKKLFSKCIKQANYIGDTLFTDNTDRDRVFISIIDSILRKHPEIHIVNFNELELESRLHTVLSNHHFPRYKVNNLSVKKEVITRIKVNGLFDDYLSDLKSKSRYTVKKAVKAFTSKSNGDYELKKISKEDEIEYFYTLLDEIFKNTWQAATFGYYNRCKTEDIHLAKISARNNWFRSYLLMFGSKPVAFVLGHQYKNTYFWEEIGFDNNYKEMSPGNALIFFSLKDAMDNDPPEIIHLGYGENLYKKIYGNYVKDATCLVLYRKYTQVHMFVLLQITLNKIYISIYKKLKNSRLEVYIRRILKHR